MNAEELRRLQAPIKARYKQDPAAAKQTFRAVGTLLQDRLACRIESRFGEIDAGLHPAAGGDGKDACSGDMLLEALVACAGVTLNAVATALDLPVKDARIRAEGDLDFKGTLGVDRETPVGFKDVRLSFDIMGDLTEEQLASLMKLTERYCVVYQTLKSPPPVKVSTKLS